jgi:CspA family cold shock protein
MRGPPRARKGPGQPGPFFISANDKDSTMATGIVRLFNVAKGFGMITPDIGGPMLFANRTEIRTPGVKILKATQRVEYDIELRAEGPAATNIRTVK